MANRIAVDAMGGDNAPLEVVKGSVEAVNEFGCDIILVGPEDIIKSELVKYKYDITKITIVNATEVISTEESPTAAIRKKKDSSIVVGLNLVKKGEAEAFVSAGSTGAVLTGATFIVGRIKGIERPALGTCLPTIKGKFAFLIDSGANVDCKPNYLVQFAKMASVYVENVMNVKNPAVGLLNIGIEKEKGNALTKEVYELLEQTNLNFKGNIEPRDIPYGEADIVVCDGFDGNVVLKLSEGLSGVLMKIIKAEITKGMYKFAAMALLKPFKSIKTQFDSEEVGGAPFLGLKSLVVKAHGSSKAKGIKNAIKQCKIFVENDIVKKIEEQL
ncbi:MAG: phosphate acyltransferase PlsX [Clostridia bacterium]|jgi:glycerol-3-phosphate acyltransferase PlsX|nr:phosphate acyltransferase PlsX [Clostridia bacterium]MCI2000328.1 phosphate acyltransferase PlsX [Clostridia bacterium]MCI2015508.1 phosphate acyltransferase PlsX [Clostridia bacterium]